MHLNEWTDQDRLDYQVQDCMENTLDRAQSADTRRTGVEGDV